MDKRKYIIEAIANIVGGAARVQTAELIVERLTEEGVLHLGYGDADVDRVVKTFTDTFGTTKTTKQDRFAAHRLVNKYGAQTIVGIIQLLGQHSQEKYMPVVGSLVDLETKLVNVLHFLRNQKGDETIDV